MHPIVALCGPIGAGKTSVSHTLAKLGWDSISTSRLLKKFKEAHGGGTSRKDMLEFGNMLDLQQPDWLTDEVAKSSPKTPVVIDAIRSSSQLKGLRELADRRDNRLVIVMVTASPETLERRIAERGETKGAAEFGGELPPYCDFQFNTDQIEAWGIARALHMMYREGVQRGGVDVVFGGQYGSEGKGHIAHHLSNEYDIFVRSGGPNAGHQTWEPGGGTYCFHHLPSGTRRNATSQVVIAAGASLWLPKFLSEVEECIADKRRLHIDRHAVIVEQSDRDFEQQLVGAIGSTAQGVGMAAARRVLRGALSTGNKVRTAADVPELAPFICDSAEYLADQLARGAMAMLEGTQGSGLSMFHGPYPFTTSRDTNVAGLLSECGIPPGRLNKVVMVMRTFPIRVAGQSGPMQGETNWEEMAKLAGIPADLLRERERTSTTKRLRRVAQFDWDLFSRAVMLNRPTDLALTFADYLDPANVGARTIDQLTHDTRQFVSKLEGTSRVPVSMISTGFGPDTIIDNRSWRRN